MKRKKGLKMACAPESPYNPHMCVIPLLEGYVPETADRCLQAKTQIGFISGKVTDAATNPYNAAQVTTSTSSLADLTGIDRH